MVTNNHPSQSINDLIETVESHITNTAWNAALVTIREFVEAIVRNPFCNGIILTIPELDTLCQQIGNAIPHATTQQANDNTVIYVASQLYTAGGHTAVIEDFIRAQPDKTHHILITNVYNSFFKKKIIDRFAKLPVTLHWADKWTMYGKFNWLRNKWISLNPAKVFLFNHHQDSAIIAAATPNMPGDIHYYHHIDFQLGLGKTLAHTIHIDMNPLSHTDCTKHAYRKQVYLPLTCHDEGARDVTPASFMRSGKLHTASSGSLKKFSSPYVYSYAQLVPEILKATGGKHTHIGPLDQRTLAIIKEGMRKLDIAVEQFQHIEFTKSLWRTLIQNNVDMFVTSFPIGGGRTAIEVMGSGTPVIGHVNAQSDFLSEGALLPPNTPTWRTPNELMQILATMTPALLSTAAIQSRAHYESYYREDNLQRQIKNHFDTCTTPVLHQTTKPDLHNDELLIQISSYMAEGRNLEGRAIPRIILSSIKRFLPYQFTTYLTQLKPRPLRDNQ